jgi:NADPH-dependent 2,4-dienoyl-CoA reductase/sulfur reductase-like enzyme
MAAPLVIVGASLAGLRAAESARASGYDGPLVLVGAEPHLPYDRPPLSKSFLVGEPEATPHTTAEQLAALGVEVRLGSPATGLDVDAREVVLGAERLPYAALVVATGAHARHLPVPEPKGVHVLRTLDDARAIRSCLDVGARTVVVGAGFIGSEVASAALARGLPVTIVEAADQPLIRAVGETAAPLCSAMHGRAGVDLRLGVGVESFESRDGRVTAVVLADGTRLPADLVVVGAGASPATGWLEGSGLALGDGVLCDVTLRAGGAPVWAAGDVARVDTAEYGPVRVEHWTNAAEQGRRAGANAAAHLTGGQAKSFASVPYFWSDMYGKKLQMVGLPRGEECEVFGDPEGPWLTLYREGDRLAAALSLDLPGRITKFRALLARGASFDDARNLALSRPIAAAAPA